MTGSARGFDPAVQRRIDAHLDEIAHVLENAGMSRDERRNVLDNVETQILEMLAARVQGEPSLQDVSAVIAELDSPESYAAGARDLEGAATPPPRMSGLAVVGAFWGALFFVALLTADGRDPGWRHFLSLVFMVVGLTGPFGMTILGAIAVSQIRESRNRLYGLGFAFADAIFYPLLALGAVLGGMAALLVRCRLYRLAQSGEARPAAVTVVIFAAALAAWAVLGWLFGRWAWGWATRRSKAA